MLQRLIIRIRHDLGHTFHIPFARLDQTFEILLGLLTDVASARVKVAGKSMIKILKVPVYPPKGAAGMVKSFLWVFIDLAGCWTCAQRPIAFSVSCRKKYYILVVISIE